jgi:hypothetical protein
LIEPDSTISTISTVSASVTLSPSTKEPVQHLTDLRTAAMDDDRVDPDLLQEHHVGRELMRDLHVAHGVAAIFDDEGRAGEAAHEGKRLGERFGLREPLFAGKFRRRF